jgi:hypothetical protein
MSVFNLVSRLKDSDVGYEFTMLWLCVLSTSEPLDHIHEILHECYAIRNQPDFTVFNLQQSAITALRVHEHLRWERQ